MVALAHRTGTRVYLGREAAMQGLALLDGATRLSTRQPICMQLYDQRIPAARTCRAVSKCFLGSPQDGHTGRRGTLALLAKARSSDCEKTERRRLGLIPFALTPRQRGLVLLNILTVVCGLNWVVLKQSEAVIDPGVFCISRFTVAALAFWPYLSKADKDVWASGFEIGIWAAIGYLAQAQGLLTTDASHAAFISTLTVIVVPILAGLTGQGVRALTAFSAVLALVGVGFLEDGFTVPSSNGDMFQLLSAAAFGVQIFRTEHHCNRLKDGTTLPLMAVVVFVIACCSVCLTGAEHIPEVRHLLLQPEQIREIIRLPSWSWAQIFPILWTGLLSTDLVLLIEVLALHDVSSTDASIIYTMEPVLGAGFSFVLLNERWGRGAWIGAALIILSSLTTQLHDLLPSRGKSEQED